MTRCWAGPFGAVEVECLYGEMQTTFVRMMMQAARQGRLTVESVRAAHGAALYASTSERARRQDTEHMDATLQDGSGSAGFDYTVTVADTLAEGDVLRVGEADGVAGHFRVAGVLPEGMRAAVRAVLADPDAPESARVAARRYLASV